MKYFSKPMFLAWRSLLFAYGSKVVDKIVVAFDYNVVRLKLISLFSAVSPLVNIAIDAAF